MDKTDFLKLFQKSVDNLDVFLQNLKQKALVLWRFCKEIFLTFPIRIKLSIILVLIVASVIIILSIIFQQSEKRILKDKLEEICNLSVRYLSYDIKDRLLLKRYEEITERVLAIKQQKIEGLDYAWVIDNEGQFIARTDTTFTIEDEEYISQEMKAALFKLENIGTRETESHYEFFYPIYFTHTVNEEQQQKFIGVAGMGFLKDIILEPIHDAQKIIFTIAFLMIIFSILGIYFLAQQMVKQIHALSEGAKEIGRGNLDVVITVNTRDELGQLAQEFNNMIMHLKEKLQMQKFVSQMTRQMIKKNVISKDENNRGEQKDVAVLFADVRNFSEFSQRHQPRYVINLVNIYLDLQARIVEKHFGVVDKFMGDQIMGVFEGKNKADNVFSAGIAIQKAIHKLNERRKRDHREVLTVGIGINLGTAVVGNIGSKDRLDYTVVGDVVNMASRFCDVAKSGQIITSLDSFKSLGSSYPANPLGSIRIKGRKDPVAICEIDYIQETIV
ncbi:HAMP domain-containing protein [candidate division KSB1 bacterium]|nr:HAMP domain-containing protein [candidate division KSB1 bacterium]